MFLYLVVGSMWLPSLWPGTWGCLPCVLLSGQGPPAPRSAAEQLQGAHGVWAGAPVPRLMTPKSSTQLQALVFSVDQKE